MEVKASLRHLRMAPRKVRLVVDAIRGLSVSEAETRLRFIQKDASRPVLKLLQSAIANAEHNFKLDRGTLYVKTITADAGVTLKRSRPRAMGRGAPIRKRSTHIAIVLSDEPKSARPAHSARPKTVIKKESPTAPRVRRSSPKSKTATEVSAAQSNA